MSDLSLLCLITGGRICTYTYTYTLCLCLYTVSPKKKIDKYTYIHIHKFAKNGGKHQATKGVDDEHGGYSPCFMVTSSTAQGGGGSFRIGNL